MPAPAFFVELIDSLVPRKALGSATPTFTRATVAYVEAVPAAGNASGGTIGTAADGIQLVSVASGEARFVGARRVSEGVWSRNYTDGTSINRNQTKGYLAEAAGTQLVTPTAAIRDFTGTWALTTMTAAKTSTGVDGAANSASRLTATGAGATALITLAGATSRTLSAYIRRVTGTGTIKLVQSATKSADLSASLNTSTYTLVQLNASTETGVAGYGIEIGTDTDAIDVDFVQFEAKAFATSRMATAGAVRNEDLLLYASQPNYGAAGTVFCKFTPAETTAAANRNLISIDNATNNERVTFYHNSGGATLAVLVVDGGGVQAAPDGGAFVAGTIAKCAAEWRTNYVRPWKDGVAVASADTAATMPTTTRIVVGNSNAGSPAMGPIKDVRIWSPGLNDAQIKGL